MNDWIIFCDFDGTICIPDSSLYLLEKFGNPMWEVWEKQVWEGKLSEREVFPLQLSTLSVEWPEARESLRSGVKVREGFADFVKWTLRKKFQFEILSSGLRNLIDEILNEAKVQGLSVHSNQVQIENGQWKFVPADSPRIESHCSHCKCAYLENAKNSGKKIIYIGDGFTDICPSYRADIIFATDSLAKACQKTDRQFYPFVTFYDIEQKLEELILNDQEPSS